MASVIVAGNTSGSVSLFAPDVSGSTVLTLPTTTGTLVVNSGAQTIEFADGSASAPSITNSGDTNTGIFFPAADTIAFAEGGAEAMRINSSGNVGVGVTPAAWSSAYKAVQINTIGSVAADTSSTLFGNNIYWNGSANIYLTTGTAASYLQSSGIHSWSSAVSGTAGNTATLNTLMTLNASGNLALQGGNTSATGVGVTFPSTQSASTNANCLDDYEEGTWSPVISGTTFTNLGRYTKIGRLVHISFGNMTGVAACAANASLTLSSLPFAIPSADWDNVVPITISWNLSPTTYADELATGRILSSSSVSMTNKGSRTTNTGDPWNLSVVYFTT